MSISRERIAEGFMTVQDQICAALEHTDGKGRFQEENWSREGGGGGRTRILQHGNVIEKGGVNFSAVHGELPDNIVQALRVKDSAFFASGVSIVLHPVSPMVPIIHMNTRYFELSDGTWWFGGGIDLTPHYVNDEDARWFHRQLKNTCDQHDPAYYPKFKTWADDYFFIKHRDETRGIGGIFFDRLQEEGGRDKHWAFVKAVAETFAPTYTELMNRRRDEAYGEREKQWQLLRRGRYVEFNLVYDKGTKFGLDTHGRIESILMSLPAMAGCEYNFQPEAGSPEARTLSLLRKGIDWA